ncbi:Rab geranylgeranyltransferase, partial [Ascosphaera aggregata]
MASHGIPRVTAAEDTTEGAILKEQEKITAYRKLVRKVQEQRAAHDKSEEALNNTSQLLSRNPEFYTAWNIRREILQHQFSSVLSTAGGSENATTATPKIQQLIQADLAFIFPLLKKSPKCYWIWNHRVWLLEQTTKFLPLSVSLRFWRQELQLVGKMLSLDNRNFHGWGYRRKVVAEIEKLMTRVQAEEEEENNKESDDADEKATSATTPSLAKEELDYTTKMIKMNLSNFSAWHGRMRTILRLLNENNASDEDRRKMLDDELALIHQALIDPYDQSLWFYHQNLMCNFGVSSTIPTSSSSSSFHDHSNKQVIAPSLTVWEKVMYVREEVEEMKEMLDGAEACRWIYLALIEARLLLARLEKKGLGEDGKKESAQTVVYKEYGASILKVFAGAFITFQSVYWIWNKLEAAYEERRGGRTAPLFADDIRRYDPRHPPSSGYNLLADIPPIRTDFELVSPSSCPHQYVLKPRQTYTPPFDGNEDANVEYRVSAVCSLCRQHLDLIVVYPTPWGHHGLFPHHLIYIPDAAQETLQKVDRNPFRKGRPPRQEFHFRSTYSQHPVRATVIVTEPFLSDAHVRVLTSIQRQEERVEAARLENPEKFMGLEVPSVKKTISILRKYVENAIQEDKRGRCINANGKTFTLSFGPRGETMKEIFESLGFIYVTSGDNNENCFWQPPEPSGSSKAPLRDAQLIHLDNLSYELFALQLSRPQTEQGLYASELFEWASAHMNRLLGVPMHIPRDQTWSWVNDNPLYGQSPDFRYFYDLGVIRSASPEEVVEAYNRQCACDPDHRRRMYYMRCLGKIGQVMAATEETCVSKALQEEYKKNKYSDEDLDLAYQVFGFDTYDEIVPTAELITTVYKQKLRCNPSV